MSHLAACYEAFTYGVIMELYNEEKIYDTQISPLMQQIIDICKEHGIPMIASFTYENCEENGAGRCTTLINNIPHRPDDANQKAANIIKKGGHETMAFAITTAS